MKRFTLFILVSTVACTPAVVDEKPSSEGTSEAVTEAAGSPSEASSDATSSDATSSDASTSDATSSSASTSDATSSDASTSILITCEPNSYSTCTLPSTCGDLPPNPDACGPNARYDEFGCPRPRCEGENDCPDGEQCVDLSACLPKECVRDIDVCEDFFDSCSCTSTAACAPDAKFCFAPEEHSCAPV